jgi:hypothetical protein
MTNPTITIHDVETGEVETRLMNAEELAQWELDQAAEAARQAADSQKAAEKAALLAKLGISESEAKLLLS